MIRTTIPEDLVTTRGKTRLITNIRFHEDVQGMFILGDDVTTIWDITRDKSRGDNIVSKEEVESIVKPISLKLIEVTLEEISRIRETDIPSIVLKRNGKFFYARTPKKMCFLGTKLFGEHKCAQECKNMSGAKCPKVRNFETRRIENYPWIKEGYQTFNVTTTAFVVSSCEHYEKWLQRDRNKTEK